MCGTCSLFHPLSFCQQHLQWFCQFHWTGTSLYWGGLLSYLGGVDYWELNVFHNKNNGSLFTEQCSFSFQFCNLLFAISVMPEGIPACVWCGVTWYGSICLNNWTGDEELSSWGLKLTTSAVTLKNFIHRLHWEIEMMRISQYLCILHSIGWALSIYKL